MAQGKPPGWADTVGEGSKGGEVGNGGVVDGKGGAGGAVGVVDCAPAAAGASSNASNTISRRFIRAV